MYAGQISSGSLDGKSGRIFLDILRFLLAAVVVLGHVTQPVFSSGFPDLTKYSILAVGGFFVLSGYTIRAITRDPARVDPLHFLVGRASRLLSVSLYALALTVICDSLSKEIAPSFYQENFSSDSDMPLLRILANVFFLSQLWGMDVSPFSNSPFWSLSYEAAFYVIWAAYLAARRGASWGYVGLVGFLYGPNILVMFAFWLLGAFLYDIENLKGRSAWMVPVAVFVVFFGFPCALFFGFLDGLDELSRLNRELVVGVSNFFASIYVDQARVQVNLMIGALVFFVGLIPILAIARFFDRFFVFPRWVGRLASFAGGLTFPMYLLHFPLLLLAYVSKFYDPSSFLQGLGFFLILLFVSHLCVLVAEPMKQMLRNSLVMIAGRSK